jgi:hypothetical protein
VYIALGSKSDVMTGPRRAWQAKDRFGWLPIHRAARSNPSTEVRASARDSRP